MFFVAVIVVVADENDVELFAGKRVNNATSVAQWHDYLTHTNKLDDGLESDWSGQERSINSEGNEIENSSLE